MKRSSGRRLSLEERVKIESMLHSNMKHAEICEWIGINRTTLYREIKKCLGSYNGEEAHRNTSRGFHPIDYEIIGKKFGLLTVEAYANKYNHRSWWRCKCDCGNSVVISRKVLTEYCSPKRPLSCGCIAKQWKSKHEDVPFEEACLRKYQDMMKFREIDKNGCWIWTGYKQKGNIPKTSWRNKSMSVRKCMYLLVNGSKYEPNAVYSKCGNLHCFHPDHITIEPPKKRVLYEDQM